MSASASATAAAAAAASWAGVGGSSAQVGAGQAQRAEIGRLDPGGAEQRRADDDLGRAAADVDDGDDLRQAPRSRGRRPRRRRAGPRRRRVRTRTWQRGRRPRAPPSARRADGALAAGGGDDHGRALDAELGRAAREGPRRSRPPRRSSSAPASRSARSRLRGGGSSAPRRRARPTPSAVDGRDEKARRVRPDIDDRDAHRAHSAGSAGQARARPSSSRPAAVGLAAGPQLRPAHHRRLVVDRACPASAARPATRSRHSRATQAWTSSAKTLSRMAWSSCRARAFSIGVEHLDPAVEVARHQVGAADEHRDALARLERVDAAVLEEPAHDRAHADVLGEPVDAGPQHADRAGADLDARARRADAA